MSTRLTQFFPSVTIWTAVVSAGWLLIASLFIASLGIAASAGAVPAVGVNVVYSPPVDAPIIDPFRPPQSFAGPGNRGLQYGTVGGELVMAAGDGIVGFAGQIGPHHFVSIDHSDGIRTTYSFLTEHLVIIGQPVARGTVVGIADAGFHLGAKMGDTYLDPELLFSPEVYGQPGNGGAARSLWRAYLISAGSSGP